MKFGDLNIPSGDKAWAMTGKQGSTCQTRKAAESRGISVQQKEAEMLSWENDMGDKPTGNKMRSMPPWREVETELLEDKTAR